MIRRTVREWERIGYGADETEIPESYADRLAARASIFSGPGGEGVLEHGRKGLRARGVVGVIAARDCQLEILPKIEGAGEAGVDDATLRHRLIHMLAVARDIRIDPGSAAQLAWQRDTILELLIRLFCNKLADALRQGMPQQYTDREDDLPALRGRLDITRQFSVLAASPQMLACRFDERSPDMTLNQVMKAATNKLSRLARASDNQRARTGVRLCGQWRGIARRLSRRGHDRACQRCASPGQRAIGGPGRGYSVGSGRLRAAHRPPLEDRPGRRRRDPLCRPTSHAPHHGARRPASMTGRCSGVSGAATRCRTRRSQTGPPVTSSAGALPRPGSRGAYPAIRSASGPHNRSPLPARGSSKCRPPGGGNRPPCRPAMPEGSLRRVVRWPASGMAHEPTLMPRKPRRARGGDHSKRKVPAPRLLMS